MVATIAAEKSATSQVITIIRSMRKDGIAVSVNPAEPAAEDVAREALSRHPLKLLSVIGRGPFEELVGIFAATLSDQHSRLSASVAPVVGDEQPCPDPRCNDHLGASPMPQCVTAVYWSEELLAVVDVLRQFSERFNGIDNGHCTVCRVGFRLWAVPGKKKGACDYEPCLSHRIEAILDRYEPPSPEILERIRKNCEAAIKSGSLAPASTVAPQKSLLRDPVRVEAVSPLVVTRDGVPCPDQAAALEEFKQACLASKYSEREREDAELGVKPDPTVAPQEQSDDGWVTFGRVKVDIDNETETFERIHPPVTPASPADIRDEAPTFKNTKEAMLYAQRHRMPAVIPATPPSRRAKAAAEEIGAWIFMLEQPLTSETDLRVATDHVESIILKRCFSTEGEDTK